MKKLSVCIISDTHNKHKQITELPDADIIIHCGDFTSLGKEHEIRNFFKWFSKLNQFKYKIIIAGNHDMMFEESSWHARSLVPSNVIYLEDNYVIIEGYKIYGTPVQKKFGNWAFNKTDEQLIKYYKEIPYDTDILITHQPPYGVFDWSVYDKINTGSSSLLSEITERINPLVSVFGHIHSGHGMKLINNTVFINASNLDEEYKYNYKPIYVEIDGNNSVKRFL